MSLSLEVKYYKDYNHNYAILESRGVSEWDAYQRRLLASNRIEGLLKCSVRDINGGVYYYYDISSKVSIENFYKGKELSYEKVKDFFIQIHMIYRSLGEFLIDERGLVLRPDCIYYDLASEKYFGLYYPVGESETKNPYEELMDFFLSHINAGDQKLVDNMYRIYEMSENKNFLLADALQVFDDAAEDIVETQAVIEENIPREIDDSEEYLFLAEDAGRNKKDVEDKSLPDGKKGGRYYIIFILISLLGICAVGWIYFNYKLTYKETMIVVCCAALMGLCLVFSCIQFALSGRKGGKKKEDEDRALREDIENEFRDEAPMELDRILDRNVNMEISHRAVPAKKKEEVKENYGETVFMDSRMQDTEYKLYALDKKNKKHIELTQFPFTIGKMAGCVDCVLMDDSISRLHARIEKRDEKILLTDMNSTNGTYKNGLRMEPSETVELEPGDEIRFGKLNYCYR